MKPILFFLGLLSVSHATTSNHRLPFVIRGGSTASAVAPDTTASAVNSTDDDNAENVVAQSPKKQLPECNFSVLQKGDGHEEDSDGIPGRFLRMQKGNRKKALKALKTSLDWREKYQVDTVLNRPNPYFDIGKAVQPAVFLGRDPKDHVIFIQRPGFMNHDLAAAADFEFDDLIRHYVYMLEYCWNIVEPRPDQTMTSILDLKNVSLKKTKQMLSFLKKFLSLMSANYPQRSYKTLMINAPHWCSMMYAICSPLLRESTRAKITICFAGKRQEQLLAEHLGEDYPKELLTGEPLKMDMPIEQEMRQFVSSCVCAVRV